MIRLFAAIAIPFEIAEAQGIAAVTYEGHHIDYAHVKTARQVLELYKSFNPS